MADKQLKLAAEFGRIRDEFIDKRRKLVLAGVNFEDMTSGDEIRLCLSAESFKTASEGAIFAHFLAQIRDKDLIDRLTDATYNIGRFG